MAIHDPECGAELTRLLGPTQLRDEARALMGELPERLQRVFVDEMAAAIESGEPGFWAIWLALIEVALATRGAR